MAIGDPVSDMAVKHVRNRTLTFAHETRSFVESDMALMIGCSMTSSGRSMFAAYSMNANPVLHPLVSRRSRMYSSKSGMLREPRSDACCMIAWKYVSSVDMRRCWHPGPAVARMRSQNLPKTKTKHVSNTPLHLSGRQDKPWEPRARNEKRDKDMRRKTYDLVSRYAAVSDW